MTIQRTRLLLGNKVAGFSDDQILSFIQNTDKTIDALFKLSVKKAIEKKKGIGVS